MTTNMPNPSLPTSGTMLMLRTCSPGGESYNGFRWPLTVGAVLEAPDWDPTPGCGGGLHGLLRGQGDPALLDWSADAVWLAVEAQCDDIVVIDAASKAKARRVVIRAVGSRAEVTAYMSERYPDALVVGRIATAGDRGIAAVGDLGTANAGRGGIANAGDGGTATAGDGGTANAGNRGIATAGDLGIANAGDRGIANAGYGGTATAGYGGTATAGEGGTATAKYDGTATAGDDGTATAGDLGFATAGDRGTATAGDRGTATAGDGGAATAGDGGAATAGDRGTATAGDGGIATAGRGGIVNIAYRDGRRRRIAVGYVGEDLEADTPYRVDDHGRFVKRPS